MNDDQRWRRPYKGTDGLSMQRTHSGRVRVWCSLCSIRRPPDHFVETDEAALKWWNEHKASEAHSIGAARTAEGKAAAAREAALLDRLLKPEE